MIITTNILTKMPEEEEIDYKSPKTKIVSILFLIVICVVGTYFITKNIVEEQSAESFQQNIIIAYDQCGQICENKIPAFTNVDLDGMDCVCLEITNHGNSTKSIIQS